MVALPIKLSPYARRHRRDLLRLIDDPGCRLHVHLDWHTLEEWIGAPDTPMFLAWHDDKLLGAIAGAPPQVDAGWLRLAAISGEVNADLVFSELWTALRGTMMEQGIRDVGALVMQPWLRDPIAHVGFTFGEYIVTLRRYGMDIPAPLRDDVHIRHVDWREAERAAAIDHAAFGPLWQLSLSSLRQAARLAASFTLAEVNGEVLGYQITTLHSGSIHLARLAVMPAAQSGGIGGALLSEMLDGFARRGILTCSVNTQGTNEKSQRLYQRYGFDFTGNNMPFWKITLSNL